MEEILYITTPIYYVNAKPHIGHAYTTIVCDVFARFNRMLGKRVKFVTGTDEHGKKIEQSAARSGMTPQVFSDQVSQLFRELLPILNVSNDDFVRTTENRHKVAVSHIWNTLHQNGYIYLGEYSGWYDIRNEAYFTEEELVDGKSPLDGREVVIMKEECYFFKLSAFQNKLLEYYESHKDFIFPESKRNEVISFVKSGLKDLAISRTTFNWGIPVPHNDKHVIYVWMDALANYLTCNNYPENQDQNNNEFWQNSLHFIGKEIVRFHAVYWPAFLMAANITPPRQIIAHGWWLSEGEKMSKSLGNVQDPVKLCNLFGSDALRYFLLRELSFGEDGNFTIESFVTRYNGFLANSYGNLCKRVITLVDKYSNGFVIKPEKFSKTDKDFVQNIDLLLEKTIELVEKYAFNRYLEKIEMATSLANQFIDQEKPWALKEFNDIKRMQDVLYILLEAIIKITKFFDPVTPIAASKILHQIDNSVRDKITVNSVDESVFPRIDVTKINEFDVYAKD
ncbi:MAG: methionine--tRNA ligase [Holosporales bacterium]|jgi:methionyl-tRNA synthetase|nr:methionine--tRNA ligase [Holosporales bacterium]